MISFKPITRSMVYIEIIDFITALLLMFKFESLKYILYNMNAHINACI